MNTNEKFNFTWASEEHEEFGSIVITDTFEEADCAWSVQHLSYCSLSDFGLCLDVLNFLHFPDSKSRVWGLDTFQGGPTSNLGLLYP